MLRNERRRNEGPGDANDLDSCYNPSCQDLGNISQRNEFMKKNKKPAKKMVEILNIIFFCPNFLDFRSVMFLFFLGGGWFLIWLFDLKSSILWPRKILGWLSGTTRWRSPSPAWELRVVGEKFKAQPLG